MKNELINKLAFLFFICLLQFSESSDYTMIILNQTQVTEKGQFAINKKGDMIIEYSSLNSRLFYGMRKNGEGFFNGKYIQILNNVTGKRYESLNSFISLNNSEDDTQYLISLGANETIVELYDIEKDLNNESNYRMNITADILGNSVYSFVNTLIELNNGTEYFFFYIYDHTYMLQVLSFSGLNLENIILRKKATSPGLTGNVENRMVDGIIVNEEYILLLFINENSYYLNTFDLNLTYQTNFRIDSVTYNDDAYGIFLKSINLKDNYVLFLYYQNDNDSPRLLLAEITKSSNYNFQPYLNASLSQYKFKSNPLLNKLIKINSQRCAFFTFKTSAFNNINDREDLIANSLTILLIDIYNNYQDIKIREYELNYSPYLTNREIDVALYNGYLCYTSSVIDYNQLLTSIFMIFGFLNQTQQENNITLNIYNYLTKKGNNDNIVDEIIRKNPIIIIENNFFGYTLQTEKVKLVSIPEQIEFYNKNDELNKLENGQILNKEHILNKKKNKIMEQGNYFFEYQIIIEEPDYDTFNNLFINIADFHSNEINPADQKDYYVPQQFYGKIFSVNFTLCPDNYALLNDNSFQCIELKYQCSYEDLLEQKCSFEEKNNTSIYDKIANEIINEYPENGESVVIEADNDYIYQITTTENELTLLNDTNNNPYNLSILDLGECGDTLKLYYNISDEQSFICLKYEKLTDIVSEKNIQYEIYHPISKEKLNLTLCEKTPISIYVPLTLLDETKEKYEQLEKQGYDLFDPEDSFYHDLCTPFQSENGTDVIINDRKTDYYQKHSNNTQCQGNCKYDNYLSNLGYIKCECGVQDNSIDSEKTAKFDNSLIFESFYNVLKNSNYKVVKCYRLVFNKDIIFKNLGSIIVFVYFIIFIIFFIVFIISGITPLKIEIMKKITQNITKSKGNRILNLNLNSNELNQKINIENNQTSKSGYKSVEKESMNPPKRKKNKKKNKNNINNNVNDIIIKKNVGKDLGIKIKDGKESYRINSKSVILLNSQINFINNSNKNNGYKLDEEIIDTKHTYLSNNIAHNQNKQFQSQLILNKNADDKNEKLDDFELNNLEYNEACEFDNRSFLDIYWSLLKREHILLFTFFIRNDYNLVCIKLSRFIFLICTDMALNVFFFTDDSMHKVYENYGKYEFIQQIPQIIYSTAVSQLLEVLLCYLSLTDKHVYQIKSLKEVKNNVQNIFIIIKCIKFKLFGFYLFTFTLFVFYWYLVSSFCAVYQNTQIIFIKDSVSSFGMGLLYPFILYMFPALFRFMALKDRNKKRFKVIYCISDIIPIF